jgi:hypothetical protein
VKAITVQNCDESGEFASLDEALAHALLHAPPGCVISVHTEECELSTNENADAETECTCESWDLVAGAEA